MASHIADLAYEGLSEAGVIKYLREEDRIPAQDALQLAQAFFSFEPETSEASPEADATSSDAASMPRIDALRLGGERDRVATAAAAPPAGEPVRSELGEDGVLHEPFTHIVRRLADSGAKLHELVEFILNKEPGLSRPEATVLAQDFVRPAPLLIQGSTPDAYDWGKYDIAEMKISQRVQSKLMATAGAGESKKMADAVSWHLVDKDAEEQLWLADNFLRRARGERPRSEN